MLYLVNYNLNYLSYSERWNMTVRPLKLVKIANAQYYVCKP